MKFSRLLILIVGAVASLSTAHCADQESNDDAYHYIKLFDGDFPIPLRFELIAWSNESLEYSSPAPLKKLRRKDLWTELPQRGFITVGARKNLDKETGDSEITQIATCGSLEISHVTPIDLSEDMKNRFPQVILIADENHYLTITDVDVNLWQELVEQFAHHMQIESSSCVI